jgi:hypothetical protein
MKPMKAARLVRKEKFAWPGGYPMALVVNDGELLCPACVASEYSQISYSHRHRINDGWRPVDVVVLEDPDNVATCAHCNKEIS